VSDKELICCATESCELICHVVLSLDLSKEYAFIIRIVLLLSPIPGVILFYFDSDILFH
jgi:hypothetical protein